MSNKSINKLTLIQQNIKKIKRDILNKPEIMSIGSGGTSVTVVNEAEDSGTESWFKSRGDAFSAIVDTSSKNNDLAFSEIAEINRFEQLSELEKITQQFLH